MFKGQYKAKGQFYLSQTIRLIICHFHKLYTSTYSIYLLTLSFIPAIIQGNGQNKVSFYIAVYITDS